MSASRLYAKLKNRYDIDLRVCVCVCAMNAAAISNLTFIIIDSPKLSRRTAETTLHTTISTSCTDEVLSEFLHEEAVPGMHVICIQQDNKDVESYSVQVYRGATSQVRSNFETNEGRDFLVRLDSLLGLESRPIKNQPWALFTHNGQRLMDQHGTAHLSSFAKRGLLLVMEGGQWIWPGVRKGFRRTVDLSLLPGSSTVLDVSNNATIETLSLHPLVLSVEGFLTDQECDWIQEDATPSLKYSHVSLMDKDRGRAASDFRTSQSTFLASRKPYLKAIDARTASLVRVPIKHQEHVQVLRYGKTEKYDAHHDYFDPIHYRNDPSTLRTIAHGKKNRMATVFWYLTDVPKGGETNFPRYDKAPQPVSMTRCSVGLKVKPQRGKVIIFYSMTPDGGLDPLSLHAACPVEEGIKWAANKWVWNAPIEL